jgi:hypothetical protein
MAELPLQVETLADRPKLVLDRLAAGRIRWE